MTLAVLRALLQRHEESGGEGLGQDDLARKLGYHAATISRALRKLRLAGEVSVHRAHAPGKKYRVLLYELTPQGREKVLSTSEVSSLQGLPAPPEIFVGRHQELNELRRGFSRGGALVVDGVPGMGKTSLVRRGMRLAPASHLTVWTALRSTTTPDALWESIRRGLGGDENPSSRAEPAIGLLGSQVTGTPADLTSLLQRTSRRVLWVVDDVQDAPKETQRALRDMLAAFNTGSKHAVVVITQRELPWPLPHGAVVHLTLKGLNRKDAISLTEALNFPEERFEEVYRETLGNPRYLRLSSREGLPKGEDFANAVLASLPEVERQALLPLALCWDSVPFQSGLLPGLTPDELETLVSQAVLERSSAGLRLPETLASRLRESARWDEVLRAHAFLAASPSLPAVERFTHAVDADRTTLAFSLLRRHRQEIQSTGDRRALSAALRLVHVLPKGRRRGLVLLVVAEIERSWGDFVAASTFLDRSLEQLPRNDPAAIRASVGLSSSLLRAGHLDQAERWVRSLNHLAGGGRWASACALARGNYHTYCGDLDLGERHFRQAERLARQHHQVEQRLDALHGLCHIAGEREQFDEVARLATLGMTLAKRHRRLDMFEKLRISRAISWSRAGRHAEALSEYRAMLEEARRSGAQLNIVSSLIGIAMEAGLGGDLKEAVRRCQEAVRVSEASQDRSIVARAYGALGEWLRRSGAKEEARRTTQRAQAISREVGPSPSAIPVQEAWGLSHAGRRSARPSSVRRAGPRPASAVRGAPPLKAAPSTDRA